MLAKKTLEDGGFVKPLLVPADSLRGPSISNPSIINKNEEIIINQKLKINSFLHENWPCFIRF
jgi:hypothetical protein